MTVRSSSIVLLVIMTLWHWSWAHPAVVLPIYVLRFAVDNATYAVSKSILNDYVPKVTPACSYCKINGCMWLIGACRAATTATRHT